MKNKLFIFSLSMAMLAGTVQNVNADTWDAAGMVAGFAANTLGSVTITKCAELALSAIKSTDYTSAALIGTVACAAQCALAPASFILNKTVSGKNKTPEGTRLGICFLHGITSAVLGAMLAGSYERQSMNFATIAGFGGLSNMLGTLIAVTNID